MYRGAALLALRPPLAYGGHAFRLVNEQLAHCVACHGVAPRWALTEQLWPTFIAARCPDLLRALEPAS